MPVQLNCTESALSEFTPVAVRLAPPVFSELLQPRPSPLGLFAHGQAITPENVGWHVTVPCAAAWGARTAASARPAERTRKDVDSEVMTELRRSRGRSARCA